MLPVPCFCSRHNRFFRACMVLMIILFWNLPLSAVASEYLKNACYRTLAEETLICRLQFCPGNYYAGGSVSFRLTPGHKETDLTGPSPSWLTITVMDREFPVVNLPDSFYTTYRHLTLGPTDYWIINEFTGGMHCCDRYHVFSRPAPGKSVIYLGATTGGAGGLPDQILSCRNGALYLEDQDVRFAYFHTPYAESKLLFPRHYQITPFTLSVDNKSFRDQYLQQVKETEADMEIILAKRQSNPASILMDKVGDAVFSDLLGQLLVKRTILYLYAGEVTIAWRILAEDIRKYYIKDDYLMKLQTEIAAILAESAY